MMNTGNTQAISGLAGETIALGLLMLHYDSVCSASNAQLKWDLVLPIQNDCIRIQVKKITTRIEFTQRVRGGLNELTGESAYGITQRVDNRYTQENCDVLLGIAIDRDTMQFATHFIPTKVSDELNVDSVSTKKLYFTKNILNEIHLVKDDAYCDEFYSKMSDSSKNNSNSLEFFMPT